MSDNNQRGEAPERSMRSRSRAASAAAQNNVAPRAKSRSRAASVRPRRARALPQGEAAAAADGNAGAREEEEGGDGLPMDLDGGESAPAAAQPPAQQASSRELEELRAMMAQQARVLEALQARLVAADTPARGSTAVDAAARPAAAGTATPARSPDASPERTAASAAAAESEETDHRKEPRLTDLREYDGEAGDQLDEWAAELRRLNHYYQLKPKKARAFAVVRLRGAADTWWTSLGADGQAAITDVDQLVTALRGRFQPVTSERVARDKLARLRQGNRHINDYINDFNKLKAQIPSSSAGDMLYLFGAGLCKELHDKLQEHGVTDLGEAIKLVARIGALASARNDTHPSRLNQLEADVSTDLEGRIQQAVLNAMHQAGGLGAKTQTRRGYGASRGGRGGMGNRNGGDRPPMTIPGVPAAVLQQRKEQGRCFRCGAGDHRSTVCPNGISAN
jgi:hypothetical protein